MNYNSCDNLESVNTVTSVFTAVGTLLIAAVAQLYSVRQREAAELQRLREELKTTCDDIDEDDFVKLFYGQKVVDAGQLVHVSGRDWYNAFNWENSFSEGKALRTRMVVSEFVDDMRAVADVFDEMTNTGMLEKCWTGKFDVKTRRMRRVVPAFCRFYTMSFDGLQENRHRYVQKEVGNERDWARIVSLMKRFSDEMDLNDFPWLAKPKAEEAEESGDEEAPSRTVSVKDASA